MKKIILMLTMLLSVFSTGVVHANEGKEECKMPPPYVGSAEFEKIKSLAGTWEGDNVMSPDGKMKVIYEVTSNGSAVLERLGPGTPSEMVSVYHDENGKLVMTHYCAIGNQPKLKLAASSADKITMVFAKGNLINPKKENHLPRPFGLFYVEDRNCYEDKMTQQISESQAKKGTGDLDALLRGKETWTIN